jgi:hypothetical protein
MGSGASTPVPEEKIAQAEIPDEVDYETGIKLVHDLHEVTDEEQKQAVKDVMAAKWTKDGDDYAKVSKADYLKAYNDHYAAEPAAEAEAAAPAEGEAAPAAVEGEAAPAAVEGEAAPAPAEGEAAPAAAEPAAEAAATEEAAPAADATPAATEEVAAPAEAAPAAEGEACEKPAEEEPKKEE